MSTTMYYIYTSLYIDDVPVAINTILDITTLSVASQTWNSILKLGEVVSFYSCF